MRKKVCMLGSFAVGKTSLVQRFVAGLFSERYMTTVGVKIDRRDVSVDGRSISLVLWDLYGEDEFQRVRSSYLRGMSGCFLVVDATRPETLGTAIALRELAVETAGDVPFLLLLNKTDLAGQGMLGEAELAPLRERGWLVLETSAKTGAGVEHAFELLAQRMMASGPDPDRPDPERHDPDLPDHDRV